MFGYNCSEFNSLEAEMMRRRVRNFLSLRLGIFCAISLGSFTQRHCRRVGFLRLGGAQIAEVFVVQQQFADGLEFLVRQHGKFAPLRRMIKIWNKCCQTSAEILPARRYSCTGKSTMMILPLKASSGWTLVSLEKSLRSGRVISGRASMEKDKLIMLRVFSDSTGYSWTQ